MTIIVINQGLPGPRDTEMEKRVPLLIREGEAHHLREGAPMP